MVVRKFRLRLKKLDIELDNDRNSNEIANIEKSNKERTKMKVENTEIRNQKSDDHSKPSYPIGHEDGQKRDDKQ